jgi:hypothetical protein
MSSLSRTYARASHRGKKLMEQYQPAGKRKRGLRTHEAWKVKGPERRHRRNRIARIARRENRA